MGPQRCESRRSRESDEQGSTYIRGNEPGWMKWMLLSLVHATLRAPFAKRNGRWVIS